MMSSLSVTMTMVAGDMPAPFYLSRRICRKIAGILKVATDVARLAIGLRIAMLCMTFYQASFIL